MKKICLINAYFGEFPIYFDLWLNSCKYNESIDFIIFTDNHDKYNYPKNVKVYYMSFNELKDIVQNNFNFKIVLDTPYKLCDYKVAYGEIFHNYISEYDFWGHCDFDLIWGNIRKFFNESILNSNDKIYIHGHCSIYRNVGFVNSRYRELMDTNKVPLFYKIYTNNKSFCFDEVNGIVKLYKEKKYNMYVKLSDIADISFKYNNFVPNFDGKNKYIFHWKAIGKKCKLDGICKDRDFIKYKEFMYIHLQKRQMKMKINNYKDYYIVPNKFINIESNLLRKYILKLFKVPNLIRKEYIFYKFNNIKKRVIK